MKLHSRILAASAVLSLLPLSSIACSSANDDDATSNASNAAALQAIDPNDPDDPEPVTPPPPTVDRFAEAVSRYNGYDYDGDGVREIESLSKMTLSCTSSPPAIAPKGMVVAIVDPRILAGSSQYSAGYVQIMLDLWCSDMRNEGYDPRFVKMKVRRQMNVPDGTTVLSMRRFLRDVRAYHNLTGAILVGDFPEPKLLRSTLVRSEIRGEQPTMIGGEPVNNKDVLSLNAELIALRSDLVLADLDGNWESTYRKEQTFRQITLLPVNGSTTDPAWPRPYTSYLGGLYNTSVETFKDVFYIKDETATVTMALGAISIATGENIEPGPELNSYDRNLTNPIARPEIHVTRINPRHVGRKPMNYIGDVPLDANGVPRVMPSSGTSDKIQWIDDTATEIRVLIDFLQRDRAFRNGSDNALPFRTAVIRSPDERLANPWTYDDILRPAHSSFTSSASVIVDNANLIQYLGWLEQPAVLRGIVSHANAQIASFTDGTVPVPPNAETIAKTGPAWRWVNDGVYWRPSFEGVGSGQMEIYRSLWENKKLLGKGQRFYVHNGCEVNSPDGGSRHNFVDWLYADKQNAEAQLFFTNGLAMLSRAKVFFDKPFGAGSAIAQKNNFGAALHGYFAHDGADSTLAPLPTSANGMDRRERTLNRKKTYFWSVIGDWTLRMKY